MKMRWLDLRGQKKSAQATENKRTVFVRLVESGRDAHSGGGGAETEEASSISGVMFFANKHKTLYHGGQSCITTQYIH